MAERGGRGKDTRDRASKNWVHINARNRRVAEARAQQYRNLRHQLGESRHAQADGFVPTRQQVHELRDRLAQKRPSDDQDKSDQAEPKRNRADSGQSEAGDQNSQGAMAKDDDDAMETETAAPLDPMGKSGKQRSAGNAGTATNISTNIGSSLKGHTPGWEKQSRTVVHRKRCYFMGEPRTDMRWQANQIYTDSSQVYSLDTKMHKMPDKDLWMYVSPEEMVEQNPAAQAFSIDAVGWRLKQFEFFEDVESPIQVVPEELPTLSHDVEWLEDSQGFLTQYGSFAKIVDGIYPTTVAGSIVDRPGVAVSLDLGVDVQQTDQTGAGNDRIVPIPGWIAVTLNQGNSTGEDQLAKRPDLLLQSNIGPIEECLGKFERNYSVNSGIMSFTANDIKNKVTALTDKLDIDKLYMGTSPLLTAPPENKWYTDKESVKPRLGDFLFRARPQSRIRTATYKVLFVKCVMETTCTFSTYMRTGYTASWDRAFLAPADAPMDDLWAPNLKTPGDTVTRRLVSRAETGLRQISDTVANTDKEDVYPVSQQTQPFGEPVAARTRSQRPTAEGTSGDSWGNAIKKTKAKAKKEMTAARALEMERKAGVKKRLDM